MVWARTYAVGCGAFRCAELDGAEDANENALFLVCHYGPGYVLYISLVLVSSDHVLLQSIYSGNFANEPPYTTGSKSCDSCPYTHKYCTNNLCCKLTM